MWPQDLCGTDWESPDVRQWKRNTPVIHVRQRLPPPPWVTVTPIPPVITATSNTLIQVHLGPAFCFINCYKSVYYRPYIQLKKKQSTSADCNLPFHHCYCPLTIKDLT